MRSALGFLTVVGGAAAPDARASRWFGLVGVLIGAVVGATWWAAGEVWTPLVAGLLAVAVDAGLTGLLHLDGLADSADGLLPPVDRSRRLQIMASPEVGAFGVVVLVVVLGLRAAAFAALMPDVLLVAGLWGASRMGMAVTMAPVPYARESGIASGFQGGRAAPTPVHLVALLGLLALLLAGPGEAATLPATAATVLAAAAAFAAVVALAVRRIGGYTGDVLGAAGVVAETAGLLAAAALW